MNDETIPNGTTGKRTKTRCFWGVHHFEVIDTQTVVNTKGNEVGRIYIQQCTNCGKIHSTNVRFYDF